MSQASSPRVDAPEPTLPARRFRLLRVYGTVARILLSYAAFKLTGIVRGKEWAELALPAVHRRNARRAKATILAVQGLFIKVGQLVSILSNFLPTDFRGELEELQDRIPPRPLAEIRGRIAAELGAPPEALFAAFDETALASASLAQVHAATLADGSRVAVKVQHLDIEVTARRDLVAIRRILKLVQLVLRIRGLLGVYEQVCAMIEEELDFAHEADSLEAIAANFRDDPAVGFPAVIRSRSSRRVLTTELVDGVKITDVAGLAALGVDRSALAERVLGAYCKMIFDDGLYHADPHPGNLLVQAGGRIVFLDFGAVARLSPALQEGIPQFVGGLLRRDRAAILAALRRIGFVQVARAGASGEDVAERVIDYFYGRFVESLEIDSFNLKDIRFDPRLKVEMIADLGRLDVTLPELAATFQIPREWILLERTILLLLGLCTHLDPEMRPLAVLRPYLERLALGGDWMAVARSVAKTWALTAFQLPGELQRLLRRAERGELEIAVRGTASATQLRYAAAHQLLFGLLALGSGALAYFAHARGDATFAFGFSVSGAVWLLALGASLLRARRWTRKLRRGR
jgi:predicted unusual protein kinase regulating ubiquinone biosynthesis (AarF/ABC1/UbiB family)